jgi:flavin reductase (DIM6/NTAB) family NADH-FMN oxidoreductase RutF
MRFDLESLDPAIGYKLMAATVVPRPIAWVTTQSEDGTVNAAPFSFFNVMGHRPPTAVLGLLRDPRKGFKDTAGNILARGDFVINLVPERLATAMNLTSMAAPAAVSELEAAGLTPAPSAHVRPPRIAESPVAFECVNHASVVTGPEQTIVIARILAIHIDDAHVLDAERGHVDTTGLGLIARMHGAGWYARTTDLFQLERPSYEAWAAARAPAQAEAEP